MLNDLARHPATAKHVAGKLARHFVADEPPRRWSSGLARTLPDTGGDLKEVAKALGGVRRSLSLPPSKLKRPSEWVTAMVRAGGGTTADPRRFTAGQATLGEPLWRPPSPEGLTPTMRRAGSTAWDNAWTSPTPTPSAWPVRSIPVSVIDSVLEATVSATTTAGGRARREPSSRRWLSSFMSPEFQRR
mgnify:CR=1 FL=1